MSKNKTYSITNESKAFFNNKADYFIGTGRMGLALQKAYI